MDYKFWLPFVVSLLYLILVYRQTKLMASQSIPTSNRLPVPVRSWANRYWPLIVMTILFVGCWIPYFLPPMTTIQQQPPVVLVGWGFDQKLGAPLPTGVYAQVGITEFAPKYRDEYQILVIARVQDNTVDGNLDPIIDKSNPFLLIGSAQIDVPFSSKSLSRLDSPKAVSVFLTVVPKKADLSEITTLNAVSTHGGFVLGGASERFDGPGH